MPATYAHYRFGIQVKDLLSIKKKIIIEQNPQLYLIGLHGPDLFFYYNPIFPNRINKIGNEEHDLSGNHFFEKAFHVIKKHEEEAYQSYLYGLFTHFALDVSCHGYVDETIQEYGISHTEIESEFDRYLLIKDGKNPCATYLAKHIAAKKNNAHIIADFYPSVDEKIVLASLRDFVLYHNLLRAPGKLKRNLLYSVMRIVGKYDELHSHIMSLDGNDLCQKSNDGLYKRYQNAKKSAVAYIESFQTDSFALDDPYGLLNHNFNSVLIIKESNNYEN